jgi:hypothetical protein
MSEVGTVPGTGGRQNRTAVSYPVGNAGARHDLHLQVRRRNVNWWQFTAGTGMSTPRQVAGEPKWLIYREGKC